MKRLFSSLALTMLVMLGASGIAEAQTYTCANAPVSITGSATIGTSSTACTFANAVTATGSLTVEGTTITDAYALTGDTGLTITSLSGAVTMKALKSTSSGGNISVTSASGAVTTTAITSKGFVDIDAQGSTGDDKITGNIQAASYVEVQAGRLIKITGTVKTTSNYASVLLYAQTTLATGAITGGPGAYVDLKANIAGGSTPFIINPSGGGGTNAVNGTITAVGMGTSPASTLVYITNGPTTSTAGITMTNATDITVQGGSGSLSGYIVIDAGAGTLTMPSGTVSANGPSGQGAGVIHLAAKEIDFPSSAATLSATQGTSVSGTHHGITLAAQTVKYGNLTLNANGNGDVSGGAYVQLETFGASSVSDNQDPTDLSIFVTDNPSLQGAITYEGTASTAPFTATANGSDTLVQVSAYPITFSGGGAVTLQSQGPGSNQVQLANPGSLSGEVGLTFSGSGTVLVDASGNGGSGGYLYIGVDQAVVSAPTLTVTASGPSSGSGNGGTLYFQTTKATLSGATVSILNNGSATGTGNAGSQTQFYSSGAVQMPSTTFTLSANGSSGGAGNGGPVSFQGSSTTVPSGLKSTITANGGGSGTGNGGAITMYPVSNITLGNNAGEFAVAATSGSTGGNGGSISIEPFGSTLTVDNTATPISVSVLGATGNGGSITLAASTLTFNGTSSQLTANGGSTSGNGGSITLSASSTLLTIGTGSSGNVQLYAKAPGNGNGGSISVTDYTGITVNSAYLSVLAGTTGNGNGGSIALTGGPATLTGSFNANGSGNGTGGTLNFQNGYFTFNGTQSFTANSLGTGQAGTITLNSTYTGQSSPLTLGTTSTLAANSENGNGGNITITAASQPIDITGDGITVLAGGNSNGGSITVTSTVNTLTITGELDANGAGTGSGGNITLSGTNTVIAGATILAEGGPSTGSNGGTVSYTNEGETFDFLDVVDDDSGSDPDGCCSNAPMIAKTKTAATVKPLSSTVFDGALMVTNSMTGHTTGCQQWIIEESVNWPFAYWDCTTSYANPTPEDMQPSVVAGSSTFSAVQGLLNESDNNTSVMTFTGSEDYNNVFNLNLTPYNGGKTIELTKDGVSRIYVSPWRNGSIGDPKATTLYSCCSGSTNQYTEVIAHELGHAVDIANGTPTEVVNGPYQIGQARDTYDLNNAIVNGSPVTRKPCTATPGSSDTAPFLNVVDYRDGAPYQNVCTAGGALNATIIGALPPNPTNSQVFAYIEVAWTTPYETNAQSFAFVSEGALGARPMFDTVMQNGFSSAQTIPQRYLGCVKTWAAAQLQGLEGGPTTTFVTPSGSCAVAP